METAGSLSYVSIPILFAVLIWFLGDRYETSAHLWLVLEYCVGGDLLTLLRQVSYFKFFIPTSRYARISF